MALKQSEGGGELIILKPKNKNEEGKQVKPYFQISRKGEDGKFVVSPDTSISSVTGTLQNIKFKEGVWKEEPYNIIQVFVRDQEELYLIDLRFGSGVRGLLNAILSLDSTNDIEISVYENKKGNTAYSLTQGGNRVDWYYTKDSAPTVGEVPKAREYQGKGGKTEYALTAVDQFYIEKVKAHAEIICGGSSNSQHEETEIPRQEQEEDEVGF